MGGGGSGRGGCLGGGSQGGCEQRIEVFVKNFPKKNWGGGGRGRVGGVRVDVIQELKFLGKITKKKIQGGGWFGGVRVGGSGWM